MAYVTYHRTAAVHATTQRRFAWGRLIALAATIGLWAGIIAAVRAVI
jgi:hypothetical protein